MLARHVEIDHSKYEYKVIFSNLDEKESKFAIQLRVLQNGQVDGLIITLPIGREKELINLKKMKIPFVINDRILELIYTARKYFLDFPSRKLTKSYSDRVLNMDTVNSIYFYNLTIISKLLILCMLSYKML